MRLNDVSLIGFALYLLCGLAVIYNVYNCPANKNDKNRGIDISSKGMWKNEIFFFTVFITKS